MTGPKPAETTPVSFLSKGALMELPSTNEKNDWPWNEGDPLSSSLISSDGAWPRITIVTPSYNQGQFIEETIRSVLLQNYPNLEYIIIDGGSTDNSVEIIRKYEDNLAYWISEPDKGQSDAINKGFKVATGDIVAWLNSDDIYCRGALAIVAAEFVRQGWPDLIYGDYVIISDDGSKGEKVTLGQYGFADLIAGKNIGQPSAFIKRGSQCSPVFVREDLNYCMDYDLWLHVSRKGRMVYLPRVLSEFRYYPASKSGGQHVKMYLEAARLLDELRDSLSEEEKKLASVGMKRWKRMAAWPLMEKYHALIRQGSFSQGVKALVEAAEISYDDVFESRNTYWLVKSLVCGMNYKLFGGIRRSANVK